MKRNDASAAREQASAPAPSDTAAGGDGGMRALGRRAFWQRTLSVAAAASLEGCGLFSSPPPPPPPPAPPPPPPPPPPRLVLKLSAAARLNPDSNGRSSPVVVRLYELKSSAQFAAADFMSLFDQDRTALAADIVAREEFVLEPGGTKTIDKLLSPDAQAVGVMAAFRDVEHARWRGTAALAAGRNNEVEIAFDGVTIKVDARDSPVKAGPPPS